MDLHPRRIPSANIPMCYSARRRLCCALIHSAPSNAAKSSLEKPCQWPNLFATRCNQEQVAPNQAARLVLAGATLEPARLATQLAAGAFWARYSQFQRALVNWQAALDVDPTIRERFYPLLLRIAEHPEGQSLFQSMLADPPTWWLDFFTYLASNAVNLDIPKLFYHWREQGRNQASKAERHAFLMRLESERRWYDAYFIWLNGLELPSAAPLGNINNGGFEQPLSNTGFGWRLHESAGTKIETALTYGIEGEKALRIAFKIERSDFRDVKVNFRNLYQYLLLAPGRYRLTGYARADNLRLPGGLHWVLRCVDHGMLVTSEPFLGNFRWRSFKAEFMVPKQHCPAQELRLEMASGQQNNINVQGGLWFDEISVRRLDSTQPAANELSNNNTLQSNQL